MNCNQNASSANNTSTKSLIKNTVRKIDQLQKEATLQNTCEGCEGSLFATMYNTRPVSFYLCQGVLFSAINPDDLTTTNVFRIEDVRDDGVILRLLVVTGEETTCTNFTVILDLDCACAMQCYAPICCEECTRNCGV